MGTGSPLPFPETPPEFVASSVDQYWWFVDRRSNWDSLHYRVVVPRTWLPVDIPPHDSGPGCPHAVLGLFRNTQAPAAELEVSVFPLFPEVAPSHWLEILLELLDENIVERRDQLTPKGLSSEFLTAAEGPKGAVISRWSAVKDGHREGGRLWVALTRTRLQDYPSCIKSLSYAHASLELANPGDLPYTETLRAHSRGAPGDFLFYCPQSWRLSEQGYTDAYTVCLQNKMGESQPGQVTFSTISRSTGHDSASLQALVTSNLTEQGYAGGTLELETADGFGGLERVLRARGEFVRQTPHGRIPCDVVLIIAERQDCFFVASLAGVAGEISCLAWAINDLALSVLCETLETADPIVPYEP
ncbi:hypothetical protein JXA88_19080 [Candidatus Fermentibacteria bacterium]|nr:hypothetical protein [Candidatus Fermentibacteria bacterium]